MPFSDYLRVGQGADPYLLGPPNYYPGPRPTSGESEAGLHVGDGDRQMERLADKLPRRL